MGKWASCALPSLIVMRRLLAIFLFLSMALAAFAWDEVSFDLPSGAKESLWRDALATALHGKIEVRIPEGRVDVVTETEAIEVDFQHKWKEGIGQCLVYAKSLGKKPVLALITYSRTPEDMTAATQALLENVEEHCKANGIRLLVMRPNRAEEFHRVSPDKKGVKHWMSKSGTRHNPTCRHFKCQGGHPCGPDEGKPCGQCGG